VSLPTVNHLAKRGHGFFSEFRAFAMRGNVVDLAVGVIIGAAFGKIVSALVDNVIMPPLGVVIGKIDLSKLQWVLVADDPATKANELTAIQYGLFLNALLQFVLVAFCVFVIVKVMNRMRAKEAEHPADPPAPTPTEQLLTEIRDELKRRA
jgi:large conductance mechanosensitive channel